ncbi:unnamed protein product [Miscanthus lutarioriparius]|uniref:Uncharacterized protein n=1 Tax=Miscanthus lutarioriparius TaxID=422564 RepID=A0A811SAJ6_9POAL|nr:unnamed protein product [Miscanthus lutarioriparius]
MAKRQVLSYYYTPTVQQTIERALEKWYASFVHPKEHGIHVTARWEASPCAGIPVQPESMCA